jgi:hypothetical protein
MSTQNLSTIAIDVVDQYHAAGKNLVRAYRAGTERAVGAVNERFASALNARALPLVTEPVKASVIQAQQQVAGFVAFGLGLGANGADITIDQLSRRVVDGIGRVSNASTKVESVIGASAFDKVGVLALPMARVSLEIANVVAKGSKRLSERVAGSDEAVDVAPVRKAAKKTARKTTARKATARRTRRA